YGTMAAKAVVRDTGRVLGMGYGHVDKIAKLIPLRPADPLSLEDALGISERAKKDSDRMVVEFKQLYDSDDDVRDLVDLALKLEDLIRNAGKHAGGVVIAPSALTDFAPLYSEGGSDGVVTQFDKDDVESVGLVKFDFLGLRTLTIIDWALGMINPRLAKEGKPPVDIAAIPIDDKRSFDLLQRYETTAVFQLESRGMKDLIKRLQPDCFEDMIALVALFRPGPLQSGMVDNFIERKHGKEAISYPDEKWQHESLQPILEPTYGIILYQEQVMQIAQTLAGYTLGGADMLRRAMGKKKPEEMAKQRAGFEEGAVKNGVDGELAMKIFDLVEKFAGYGFNKSHSAAYALVSYQTLWLKTHFPAEFMAAVMTADMDNTDKIVTLVDECQRMGLTVIPPDVNTGRYRFSVNEDGHIVYGIGAVKGVGEGPIDAILEARDRDGPFRDLFDFCNRVDIKKLNKRVMEKLILSGAMDRLGPHRAALMATLEEAMRAAEQHAKAQAVGQVDMFGVLTEEIDDVKKAFANVPHWPDKVRLEGERETLGLYLTGHPINQYSGELRRYTSGRLCDLHPTSRDTVTTAAGLVIAARSMVTKRGNKMGIFTLDDRSGRLDVTLFSEALEKYEELMQKDRILVVSGQVSFDDFSGGLKMSARELLDINDARERFARAIRISLDEQQIDDRFFPRLCEILEPARAGVCPVQVNYRRPGSRVRLTLGTEWRVTPTDQLIDDLRVLLGRERVELVFD
ncbi:DNA polymerase III subunit alpha, partial [Aeromonas sp.]|uniref:DNA polymerase III subunit alpha n=1 Tax=Aeromonas sp. TaxID=647 RepID=UPI00258D4072